MMKTPFSNALPAYCARFGRRPDSAVLRLLTGQQRSFTDTVSVKDASLFLLAHAAQEGYPVVLYAPLMNMCRLEWRLQELGAPEGSVTFIHEDRPYAAAEMALVYRLHVKPLLVSWSLFVN